MVTVIVLGIIIESPHVGTCPQDQVADVSQSPEAKAIQTAPFENDITKTLKTKTSIIFFKFSYEFVQIYIFFKFNYKITAQNAHVLLRMPLRALILLAYKIFSPINSIFRGLYHFFTPEISIWGICKLKNYYLCRPFKKT